MKVCKVAIIVLVFIIIGSMLTACGGQPEAQENNPTTGKSEDSGQGKGNNKPDDASYNTQTAITEIIEDYIEAKEIVWELISKDSNSVMLMMELMPLTTNDLMLATLPMYDMLDVTGSLKGRVEGLLMGSNINAFKEVEGKTINFGYEHVLDEAQSGYYEKGDILSEAGSFNVKTQELSNENYVLRNNTKIGRGIFELVRLPDGKFISQSFSFNPELESSIVFLNLSENHADIIIATSENKVEIEYQSILGKGEISAEEMAEGYKVVLIINVVDGKVNIKKP